MEKKPITKQDITGKWASIVTDSPSNSSLLLAEFKETGRFCFIWVRGLPSAPQESGSQPATGNIEEGQYYVQGNILYLKLSGHRSFEPWTITLKKLQPDEPTILILAFDEHRIWTLMKMTSDAGFAD